MSDLESCLPDELSLRPGGFNINSYLVLFQEHPHTAFAVAGEMAFTLRSFKTVSGLRSKMGFMVLLTIVN